MAPQGIQVLQVATIVVGAPLVSGVIAHVEARLQGRRGPRILQPYYDLSKLFCKETLVTEESSWVFLAGPVVAFGCYLVVPLLIPVLTTYGLPLGYMGDIMGGGLILALAGFAVALASTESGAPYAQLGGSRAMTFGALIEPTVLFVVFVVALITGTDLPYAMAATVRSSSSEIVSPAHVLAAIAFFLVVLSDTGRIPVETHAGTLELGMIDEARTLEHSGSSLALLQWGSAMKQLILYTILINVLVAPWGLAATGTPRAVLLAIPALLGKAIALGCVFAVVDNLFSKLRLFKITEFVAAAFLLSVLAVFVFYAGGG
ncbi:MAG: NADH-quinone oxidoreductase subunit H [Actinomycetota bacterium]|jgi:formate hydrogenlyase subunit 4|nr:NADH-quinone oxidoreductase subunit H [Actinomycetota bacterium]